MWSSMKITLPLIWDQNKFPSGGWWKVSLLSVCVHFWHTDTKWTQSLTTNFCLVSKFSIIEWQSGYQEKEYQSISSSCTSVWSSREIYFQTWGSGCSSSLLQVRKNILTCPSFVWALICALLIKSILVLWGHYQLPTKLRLIGFVLQN